MKYIRTKDGRIIKISDWENYLKLKVVKITKSHFCELKLKVDRMYEDTETYKNYWYKTKIIVQADTIEELCDGYIIVPNTKYGIPFTRRIDDFDFLHPLDKDITEAIYGFIKTDRGLIYVAKMNEKGELELL